MNNSQIKRCLNHEVRFIDGKLKTIFVFTACIFKLGPNGYYYTAELYDKRTNSTIFCRLEEIEEVRHEQRI